jgi:LCP family protein required for cell wall assembly
MVLYMFKRKREQNSLDPLSNYQTATNTSAASGAWVYRKPGADQKPRRPAKPIKPPRDIGRIIKRTLLGIFVLLVAGVIWAIFTIGHGKFSLASLLGSTVKNIILHETSPIAQSGGRTNMLVYGMTEDGLRTDSIILVSYYWQQKKLVMLNIPRDLYVYDGYENDKMGEVYAYAKNREPKNSTYPDTYVASVISKEYNIPIQYWAQFNMQGEVDFVNAIGGITVDVPDSFTDCEYPTWNYSGYVRPCPSFTAGVQTMNGSEALIFSRSRHSLQNNEGTDFARSRRQQLVIESVLTKLKGMGVVGNIADISKYLSILGANLTTDMTTDQMVSFAKTLHSLSPSSDIVRASWDTGNGFLCDSSTSSGEYITLYGIPSDCTVGAGGFHDNQYREYAIYFVQHMLQSAPEAPTTFIQSAATALGYSTPSSSPTP